MATSGQMGRADEKLHGVRATILTKSKELEEAAQLNTSVGDLKESVALFRASEKGMKDELAKKTEESTRARALLENERARVSELRPKLAVKDAVVK